MKALDNITHSTAPF